MITITPRAAEKVRDSAKQSKADNFPLRIAVTDNPDGSFHYAFGFDEEYKPTDVNVESEGVTLVYTMDQADKLDQMVIDYVELEPGNENFVFLNPNDPTYVAPGK